MANSRVEAKEEIWVLRLAQASNYSVGVKCPHHSGMFREVQGCSGCIITWK